MQYSISRCLLASLIAALSAGVTVQAADAPTEKTDATQKEKTPAKPGRPKLPMKKMKGPPNPVERGSCELVSCIDDVKKK